MREVQEELVVLEEGHVAGVVHGCCASANSAKLN